jgi:ferritin-like protein
MLKHCSENSTIDSRGSGLAGKNQGHSSFCRRGFLKRLGWSGTAILPAAGWLTGSATARADSGGGLSRGDTAILRFLAAVEYLETDFWQQYTELALGNAAYQQALQVLDGDMPTYLNQNTRDEFSHRDFLNAYLESKGRKGVNLEEFRTLPSSQATGANKTAKRLTSLMNLTVDTSWYVKYRSTGNPDFGDTFPQLVELVDLPTIPNSDLPANSDAIQLMANAAAFHFAAFEQAGMSVYDSFIPRASSQEVVKILAAIGGSEVMHFQIWQDKAGNAPPVPAATGALFPQLPIAPDQTPNGVDPASPMDTNQVMPLPCKFISPRLPLCSVVRPTSTQHAGALAAAKAVAASGLFQGQSAAFFDAVLSLAAAADEARGERD